MSKSQLIFVVDDEPAIRDILESVLSDEGYPVITCQNSEFFMINWKKISRTGAA